MTLDKNKSILRIDYNHLNLPIYILFDGEGRSISYIYDANGIKVRKIVNNSAAVNPIATTDYLDGFQYLNSILEYFPHAEGYVKSTDVSGVNNYNYIFNYTDHLGNIRLSYGEDTENVGELKIFEENNYYPFGLKHKNYNMSQRMYNKTGGGTIGICLACPTGYNYKYNGKELQDELGLNMYDYGARNYDPAIGRWMNIDPLADERQDLSPYNYVQNNPLLRIDPTGMLDTHYEDEFGNTLADTNDGNDATVVVSNENSKAFQEEFNNTSVMHQDGVAKNSEWISKYGEAMVAMPGDNVTNWAVDAISNGNAKLDAKSLESNTTATKDGFKINPTGPALILAGQKLLPKLGGLGGGGAAGAWTSVASKSLRFSDRVIQNALGTNYKLPAKGILHRLLGTRGVGAAAGRAVPYLGYILTSYELGTIIGPSKWYGNDDSKWFD